MTPLQYFSGCCMMLTSVWLAMQAAIVRGEYGWRARPWPRRAMMAIVAVLLMTRGLSVVFHEVALNLLGIGISIGMCAWQFLELQSVVTSAFKEQTQRAERDALFATAFPQALQPPAYSKFQERQP